MAKIIGITVGVILLVGGVLFGANYYNNRYVGSTVYFIAPKTPEKTDYKDDFGKLIDDKGAYEYGKIKVKIVTETGADNTVPLATEREPLAEGQYYKGTASKTIFTGDVIQVSPDKVPDQVKKALK